MAQQEAPSSTNFIKNIIDQDLKENKNNGRVQTRFPPEPNGYLHIGHAKSIVLNFGLAEEYNGKCNLRFDDTNPVKEEQQYVDSIKKDVHWLGYDWKNRLYFASDYFDKLYRFAQDLIHQGKAYVDSLSTEEIRQYRGTLTEPGQESPYRGRSVEENLDLFRRMREGEFAEGEHVLRAKIDMNSPNINMRDPVIYRILSTHHHRTGEDWSIYPMYDFTHCLSDAEEYVTHSLCTLEFEDHRPLYNWFIEQLDVPSRPRQIEFARLNLTYTVLSKRKLLHLVRQGIVDGWDDPLMPTISGMRRRGYTANAIKKFCNMIGVAKSDNIVDIAMLEHAVREDLNLHAPRAMAVLEPIRLIIDNYPEDDEEWLEADNNPEDPAAGKRKIPFTRELFIEANDFREDPPRKFHRLAPGKEVRLVHAYYITCTSVDKDPTTGEILTIHATYDPQTKGGWSQDGRKVKGTIHWVSGKHADNAEVRLFDHLFTVENPEEIKGDGEFLNYLNHNAVESKNNCLIEPGLAEISAEQEKSTYQFLRLGYFKMDHKLSQPGKPVFNRTVNLRDSWAKIAKKVENKG